eukprot:gene52987-biopygen10970
MRLAHFDPPGPLDRITPADVCTAAAIAVARDGAAQGCVLLKNDASALPLPVGGTVRHLQWGLGGICPRVLRGGSAGSPCLTPLTSH